MSKEIKREREEPREGDEMFRTVCVCVCVRVILMNRDERKASVTLNPLFELCYVCVPCLHSPGNIGSVTYLS